MSQQDGAAGRPPHRENEPLEQWVAYPPTAPSQPAGAPELVAAPSDGLPFGLAPADGTDALRVVARAFLPVLGALTVLVGVLAQAVLPDGHEGSPADWLRTAVVLTAMSMGGRAALDGSVGAVGGGVAEMSTAVRLTPLTVTLVLLVLVARGGARAERRQPSTGRAHLLARSLVPGLVAGLGLAAAALLARTATLYGLDLAGSFGRAGAGVHFGAGPLGTLLGTSLLVSLTTLAARASVGRVSLVPSTPERGAGRSWSLRVLRTAAAGLAVCAGVLLVVALLFQAAVGDDLDGNRPQELAALALLGPNLVLVLCLLALGIPLTFGAPGSGNSDVLLELLAADTGDDRSLSLLDAPPALLLLLVPVVVVLGTAVRRSLRNPQPPTPASGVRLAAAVGVLAAVAAALVLRISVDASGTGSGAFGRSAGASAGPSLLWAPLLAAGWAALVVAATRFGPTLALSLPPRVSRALAGRDIRPAWAATLAGTAPAPAGRRSAAVRGGLAAVAGAAVLGLAGLIAVAVVDAVVHTPQAAAEEYLAAVADADVERVREHLETPLEGPGVLLGPDVLSSADFTPISDVRVGRVERRGRSAVVHVVYTVAGQQMRDSLEMVPGESRYGLLRTWQVAGGLPGVEVPPQPPLEVTLSGLSVGDGWYPALPGGYTFRAAENRMLTADEIRIVVTAAGQNGPVVLEPRVRPGLLEEAERAVRDGIERCARSTALPADGCPFLSDGWFAPELSDVTVRITVMPTIRLMYDEPLGGFLIVTESPGSLTLTGTQTIESFSSPPEEQPYAADRVFGVSGFVIGSGDELVVEFDR
jgi:hypothetical protein